MSRTGGQATFGWGAGFGGMFGMMDEEGAALARIDGGQ